MVREINLIEYYNIKLPAIADKLEREYYAPVRALCEEAISLAMGLTKKSGTQSPERIYTNFCLHLLFTIKHDITERQDFLVPSVKALYEKKQDGHDCATCTGNCKLNDNVNFIPIGEANNVILDSLCRLHKLAIPAYLHTEQTVGYKELRYKMLGIYTALLELFFIEESALFTAIAELQEHTV